MAGQKLTQETIDQLKAKISRHRFLVSFGEDIIGPLKSAPQIEADIETKEMTLYETGEDPQADVISRNNATITLDTEDMAKALELLGAFRKGDDMLDTSKSKPLTFVPITNDASDSLAKTLTFPNAFLNPGLATNFGEGSDPNSVPLTFTAKPQASDGVLFTYE
jgi:hypothetical protein